MNITTAAAGSQPVAVSNSSTTYTVSVLLPSKITARLGSNMPAGVTLTITLAAPTAASSTGAVALDATARDVVTNVTNIVAETRGITYRLSALVSAGVISSRTAGVTLTIVTAP
jgi:hypothetical protein